MKNIIQGLWIGKSLSLMEQLSIKSFLANGHEYHLYVYRKVKNVPRNTVIKDANEILPEQMIFKYRDKEHEGGFSGFSNLFRYKLLSEKGGFGVDLDVVCLKNWDFDASYVFATERSYRKKPDSICAGIIKAPQASDFIKECYESANSMDIKTLRFRQNGMFLLHSLIEKYELKRYVASPDVFCPIDHWEWIKFIDQNLDFSISEKTYGIHLWHELWRLAMKNIINRLLRKIDSNILYGEKTLYGRLQRMYL